jgi:hypothetical protein
MLYTSRDLFDFTEVFERVVSSPASHPTQGMPSESNELTNSS